MKIKVNSTAFANDIERAFEANCHYIAWDGNTGHLTFGTTKYQSDVLHFTERQVNVRDQVEFNNLGMAKLLVFLRRLKMQPITLTLEDGTIRVEHSVIDFI